MRNGEKKTDTRAKSRYFSGITYLSTTDLVKRLQEKGTSIRAYAVIDHNKDEKEPHRHFVIRTHSTWTPTAVLKWFPRPFDINGKEINTFIEIVHDRQGIVDYLTHKNELDKHHYDESEIIDHGLTDLVPQGETSDDTFEIIEMMLQGVPTRELVRLYGRDFLYHYGAYKAVADQIRAEEGVAYAEY